MSRRGEVRRSECFCGCSSGRETDLAWVAQLVERVLGKDEVTGSIPVPGSRFSGSEWRGGSRKEFLEDTGGGNSTVESHSSKVMVAGSKSLPPLKKFLACGWQLLAGV